MTVAQSNAQCPAPGSAARSAVAPATDDSRGPAPGAALLSAITLVLIVVIAARGVQRTVLSTQRGTLAAPEGAWRVDLNTASAAELALLPGVGPSIATRVIDSRRRDGLFTTVDQLRRIRGIGPVTLERVRPWVVRPPQCREGGPVMPPEPA